MTAPHDPESLARLAALVDTLLDAPPERRGALIDELSAGDPARRAELAALLRECEEEPALFRQSATGRFAAAHALILKCSVDLVPYLHAIFYTRLSLKTAGTHQDLKGF